MKNDSSLESQKQIEQARPCLHCALIQAIDDFFCEFPSDVDKYNAPQDTGEIFKGLTMLVADIIHCFDKTTRKRISKKFMDGVSKYVRMLDAQNTIGSNTKH
jgi:hypothetical protein